MSHEAAMQLTHLLAPVLTWLEDHTTEEVAINRPGELFVRQKGVFSRHEATFTFDDLEDIAILAGALRKQDVGPINPLCSTELPNGERLQICVPPAVPRGTASLTIRRPGYSVSGLASVGSRYETSGWNKWNERNERGERNHAAVLGEYDNGDIESFLKACVHNRLTMLLCGATGSGKTTMSKTLISAIPLTERLITIEDTMELVIPHENHVRLLYSKNNNGRGGVTAEHLLQASLRMRPDRILLGEMRDDAAWAYLNEVVSGHPGSISTIHGATPAQALKKLFSLVKGSPQGSALEDKTVLEILSSAIDVIVPFHTAGESYSIGEVWLRADAQRRGEPLSQLLN
ncbi:P-type DNA transfer ATPase VirB11 [Rhizobium leguminosarum]|uniref:P-type DNA transfer ATPase VirB11 n=1 Tax=Rhizobium TaxID=379 RepID=UPI00102F9207|nr:P-type DNA transfer ATPase VirB11 [Rhizobium leguminosarum]TBF87513.1 P-type DNA transfer ATPase VirB11 [Rhizobium leguminosarum]TBG06989.1 P-type DNA transfer ATPase VirB11 [Rhizobium leguminosarum]TBG07860.1 P-type DNA transfer ATPase VirB11 [Rhizobium leguminosarum]TBG30026.1 P-type DNA transfer ATPase VirB11 [Rhizobium leguminosarum]TBG50159.1 P-type DNA transfer ATPase VirB11 [Rhizobium leguminosarum]